MTRRFVVIKRFKDLEDSNRVYRGGDFIHVKELN